MLEGLQDARATKTGEDDVMLDRHGAGIAATG